jgi:DNA-binding IclR family transcriptional regulator
LASETVQVVERSIDVLFCFAGEVDDLGVSEIARRLSISKGAVHRLLVALRNKGLLVEDLRTRRYRLGVRVLELSGALLGRLDVRDRARVYLRRLRDLSGETTGLAVRAGSHRVYIEQEPSRQELRQTFDLGKPVPLYAGAASKAILAHLTEQDISQIVGENGLEAMTGTTIVDREALLAELQLIRRRGFALSNGERIPGARSIAAPVFGLGGEVYALNVSGPFSRFTEGTALGWAPRLLECAQQLSAELGHVGA